MRWVEIQAKHKNKTFLIFENNRGEKKRKQFPVATQHHRNKQWMTVDII